MVKMRLQGSKNEIRWLIKLLEKDVRLDLVDTSDFYAGLPDTTYNDLFDYSTRYQSA